MAFLYFTQGPATGQQFSLEGHRLVMIGRDASCTIQVVDPQLSRNHLQIEHVIDEGCHYAIDYQSKNGVYVNGQKIDRRAPLGDRDIITIGDTTIVYSKGDSTYAQHVLDAAKKFGQGHLNTQTGG